MKNHAKESVSSVEFSTEEVFHLIFRNIDEIFMFIDADLRIVFASKSAIDKISTKLGLDVRPGMSILDIVAPDRVEMVRQLYADVLNGSERKTEVNFLDEDGSRAYVENHFLPARTSTGEVVGVIVTATNISEKKRAEISLKEAEERWRFALEGSNQGVWDWNIPTGKVVYSNSFLRMFGYSTGDLSDFSDWLNNLHPEDRPWMEERVNQYINSNRNAIETTFRFKAGSGEYKWVQSKGIIIRNNAGVANRMIGINTDLTETISAEEELKKANDELKLANERFNIMMKATHDMIWDWDLQNNFVYRSEDGLRKVYGVENNASIHTTNQWMSRIHPEDFKKVEKIIGDILTTRDKEVFEVEYRFRRDDGTYTYVYDRGIIVRNENNVPIRMIGAAQDVSERKKLQNEILQNELEYRKYINQATVDSQEQERTEIGKELHDNVNQVLTTTKLYLDLALTSKEVKDDMIRKSIDSITSVIKEIRQLSRSLMDPTIDDLGIVDSLNDLIENINLTKQIHVELHADPSIEDFLSKNQKLTTFRIVQESLNNVIKHAKATNVVVRFTHAEGIAELSVEDDGIGFNPYMVKRGAGLKNIQNRVYLINGTHSIDSKPNSGCRLLIKFPFNNNK